MSRGLRRRDVLRACIAVVTSGVAGCFQEVRNPGGDPENTPSPTPEPKQMEPFDATHAGRFASTRPIERGIHKRINRARVTRNIEKMNWDPNLAYLGRVHARDMAKRDFYSHTNPDGKGPGERMIEYGLDDNFFSISENIAKRPLRDKTEEPDTVARKFFEMWKNSEAHWSNILDSDWDRHGVGVYIAEDGWMYAASEFAIVEPNP